MGYRFRECYEAGVVSSVQWVSFYEIKNADVDEMVED